MASPEEPELPEWAAYKGDPSQETLGKLLSINDDAQQRAILAEMQKLYFATKNWRVAQHIALVLAGVHVTGWPSDHALAEYYANCARELSSGNPLATILLAWLHWGRRLPQAVLYDLEQIDKVRGTTWPSEQFTAEYYTLLSMCWSYMGHSSRALETILEAEHSYGIVSPAACNQLIVALTPDDPALDSVAMRFAHEADQLNPPYQRLLGDAVKRRFLRLLLTRLHA